MIAKIRTTVYASLFSRKERRVVFHTEKIDVHRLFGACPCSFPRNAVNPIAQNPKKKNSRRLLHGLLAVVSAVGKG